MKYIKVSSDIDCLEADKLFNELVKYESNIDSVISSNCIIKGFNENIIKDDTNFVYYVKDNEVSVAYIFAYLKTKYNDVIKSNIIEVECLYVKEEFRNKGIGKKLIETLENWAKNKFKEYKIEITCLSNNTKALGFYKKLGYSEIKTVLRK